MGYINLSYTRVTTGGTFPAESKLFVGFSREGGRTEQVQHTPVSATEPREVYLSQKLTAATQSLKDALSAASWLSDLRVTTDPTIGMTPDTIVDASWTTRYGQQGHASSRAEIPSNIQRVIAAANAVEELAAHGRTQLPYAPGG